jgi:IS5 family transposase
MEEAFFDTPLYREFAQLEEFARLPDESTILRFRHRLEKHKLAEQILAVVNDILIQRGLLLKLGTVVDATLIAAQLNTLKTSKKCSLPYTHTGCISASATEIALVPATFLERSTPTRAIVCARLSWLMASPATSTATPL